MLSTRGLRLSPPLVPALLLVLISRPGAATSEWLSTTAPEALFEAAGLPPAPDRALSVLTLIRAMHQTADSQPPESERLQSAIEQSGGDGLGGARVLVPLPLPAAVFEAVMRVRPVTADRFLLALLRDRRASWLYYATMAMDASTRAFLAARPALVRAIAAEDAGTLAAFGRSIRVEADRVVVPGGEAAVPLWEEIVGARITDPDAFIRRLVEAREGRIAYMFDAIAHLDPARQRFALGLWMPDGSARMDRLRTVLRGFTDIDREWSFPSSPFGRPRHDAPLLLRLVPVTADGAPAGPAGRGFWDAAFDSTDLPGNPGRAFRDIARDGIIDAAFLIEQIVLPSPPLRRVRFETYAFGVRRFGSSDPASAPDAIVALRAFARYPAVMLSLERIGIRTPSAYAAVARTCERVADIENVGRGHTALAQFQGALAAVDRVARSGRLDAKAAEAIVTSLTQVEIRNERYAGRLAAWIDAQLLPALRLADGGGPPDSAEGTLLRALADRSPDGDGTRLEWEGLSYMVDVNAGERARVEQVRGRQGGERLDDVLIAARALRGKAARPREVDAVDERLAKVLVAMAYAPHQGDPLELFPAAAALYGRHDFGLDRPGVTMEARRWAPWARPRIGDIAGQQVRVEGSLLGLDLALARFAVRRLVSDRMPNPPTLNQNDRAAVIESAVLLNPRDLTSAQMKTIAQGLAGGRRRILEARSAPERLDQLAVTAGVGESRRQVLSWMASRGDAPVEEVFTLAEVLRLGRSDTASDDQSYRAWGMTNEPFDGCYCQAFPDATAWENFTGRPGSGQIAAWLPDLMLRLAELFAEIGAPAALLPATYAYAAQDFVDEAPAMHTDDGGALVQQARALQRVRVEDYLAAVAARGPLRPVTP